MKKRMKYENPLLRTKINLLIEKLIFVLASKSSSSFLNNLRTVITSIETYEVANATQKVSIKNWNTCLLRFFCKIPNRFIISLMMCEKTIPSIKNMARRWKKTWESLSNENAKKVLMMAKLPHPTS